MEQTYFRRGFGLKGHIEGALAADYHSRVVDQIRARGYVLTAGDLTFKLAGEFGFCYGVDRAVEYAYETRTKFPERQVFLVGEIIHNPHVNKKLQAMGVEFLRRPDDGEFDFANVTPADVVILPAFGVTVQDFERLRAIGCVLVDTTCGSVLNVWKRVESYAKDGFTAVIHGKYHHEETKATASQVSKYGGGTYVVVRDMAEARELCAYIEGAGSGSFGSLRARCPRDSTLIATSCAWAWRIRPPCFRARAWRSQPSFDRAWPSATATERCRSTSGRSTPSARQRRIARTRC